jgi:hypothetical protein
MDGKFDCHQEARIRIARLKLALVKFYSAAGDGQAEAGAAARAIAIGIDPVERVEDAW